jgi:hypothetical protein
LILQVSDVLDAAGGQVIEDVDLIAILEKPLGEMAADETSASGDQKTRQKTLTQLERPVEDPIAVSRT